MPLSPETRDRLKRVSTATLATALYRRGLRGQMVQGAQPLHEPTGESMVGEAFTLRYMPAREDLNRLEVFRDRGHPQRRAVEECPPGAVLVMDSRKDARAASATSRSSGPVPRRRRDRPILRRPASSARALRSPAASRYPRPSPAIAPARSR